MLLQEVPLGLLTLLDNGSGIWMIGLARTCLAPQKVRPSAAEKAQSLEKVEAEDTEEQESEQFWMGALSDALASKQHVSGGQLRVVWFQVLFFDLVCVV